MIAQNGEARRVIFDIVPQQKKSQPLRPGQICKILLNPSTSAHAPPLRMTQFSFTSANSDLH